MQPATLRRLRSGASLIVAAIAWAYLASLPLLGRSTTTQRVGFALLALAIVTSIAASALGLAGKAKGARRTGLASGAVGLVGAGLAGSWVTAAAMVAALVAVHVLVREGP